MPVFFKLFPPRRICASSSGAMVMCASCEVDLDEGSSHSAVTQEAATKPGRASCRAKVAVPRISHRLSACCWPLHRDCAQYNIHRGYRATLMRHDLVAGTVTTRSLGVGEAAPAAYLITPARFALRLAPGALRTAARTVDLATIASAAHQHRDRAGGTQKKAGRSFHPRSRSSRRALDEGSNE